jgi:threonylcarbamoyladenosine tRNA methylthiotransferase MtaB
MKVAFQTFGCRLNRAETLDLESQYTAAGHETVHLPQTADDDSVNPDVVIVRCCSVTAKAQKDCEKKIQQLSNRFPKAEVLIIGCHPNAKPIPAHLLPPALPNSIIPVNRQLSRAYLKVQDGCSGKCAFCIVPAFRGSPKSIPFTQAIEQCKAYIDSGFCEINVTGCNLCLYKDGSNRLPELVSALAEIDSSGHRIRLGSIEPGLCDKALIDAMEAHQNICRFIHISLQSASDRVLRRMRRPYTIEKVQNFCSDARARLGERLALGADIIAGFPGETENDFQTTKEFLADSPISNFHVFPYSERKGTEGATMKPAVPMEIRRRRAKELELIGIANRKKFAESFIGRSVKVCIERDGNGYSDEYLHCILEGSAPRRSIVLADVKDYSHKNNSLFATIRTKQQ